MARSLIALGSNLGDRRRLLDAAVQRLTAIAGVHSVHTSAWHETQPVGGPPNQSPFLNGAAVLETTLSPEALLASLEQIEQELGRTRAQRWAPRTIDLDLLLYDQLIVRTPTLILPHPRMAMRRFVLDPAAEIAPSMVHPTIGWTVAQLLDHLRTAVPYVAISSIGLPQAFRNLSDHLAAAVTKKFGWRFLAGQTTEIPPLDSPSLTLSWAIEFLRQQTQLLARSIWPKAPPGAISPFWIEDLLALGDVLWPGALDSAWQELSPTVVKPKLLVIHADSVTSETNQSLSERMTVAVRTRAARRDIGPVLWLDFADFNTVEVELFAAIEAMN